MVAVHKSPLLFCLPAGQSRGLDTAQSSISDQEWNSPAPWPADTTLRVKVLPKQITFDVVLNIIKTTAAQWLRDSKSVLGLRIEWVAEQDLADIRISFRTNEPNWSCIGNRAAMYDQSQATMNFSFGSWQDSKAVYSHAHIARAAAHLFGHAFGLPHASQSWSSSWNEIELTKRFGQPLAMRASRESGCSDLTRPDSIMRFDRPAIFTSNVDDRAGGWKIDAESQALLRKLYPPWLDVFLLPVAASLMPKFNRAGRIGVATVNDAAVGERKFDTPMTSRAVTGLSKIDLNTDADFRLSSSVTAAPPGSALQVLLGSTQNTLLHDAECNILSFDESDHRFLTGVVDSRNHLGGDLQRGQLPDVRVTFERAFRTVPAVVVFINSFDTAYGLRIRLKVKPKAVTQRDFVINMDTWDDSFVNGLKVSWVAYESDEPSVRSGVFEMPDHGGDTLAEDQLKLAFSPPMKAKPRFVFTAFSHIDVRPDQNPRVLCKAKEWDEQSITGHCYTWVWDSAYRQLKFCYIAIH